MLSNADRTGIGGNLVFSHIVDPGWSYLGDNTFQRQTALAKYSCVTPPTWDILISLDQSSDTSTTSDVTAEQHRLASGYPFQSSESNTPASTPASKLATPLGPSSGQSSWQWPPLGQPGGDMKPPVYLQSEGSCMVLMNQKHLVLQTLLHK